MEPRDIDFKAVIHTLQETSPSKKLICYFIHWLRKKQALKPFLSNFISHNRYRLRLPQYFVNDAFTWDETREGCDFWHGLDSQWYRYCNKNQLSVWDE